MAALSREKALALPLLLALMYLCFCRHVDISSFIGKLPQGTSTTDFSTADASGSTSQATNILEAIEVRWVALRISLIELTDMIHRLFRPERICC